MTRRTLIFKKKNTGELRDREFAGNFKASFSRGALARYSSTA